MVYLFGWSIYIIQKKIPIGGISRIFREDDFSVEEIQGLYRLRCELELFRRSLKDILNVQKILNQADKSKIRSQIHYAFCYYLLIHLFGWNRRLPTAWNGSGIPLRFVSGWSKPGWEKIGWRNELTFEVVIEWLKTDVTHTFKKSSGIWIEGVIWL